MLSGDQNRYKTNRKCNNLPVIPRKAEFEEIVLELEKLIVTNRNVNLLNAEAILLNLEKVSLCYVDAFKHKFRIILSHLLINVQQHYASIDYMIRKFPICFQLPSISGNYPLHEACYIIRSGKKVEEELLLRMIAVAPESVYSLNVKGENPLHILLSCNTSCNHNCVKYLLLANSMVARCKNESGKLPIHLLLKNSTFNHEIAQLLAEAYPQGMHVEASDEIIQLRVGNGNSNTETSVAGKKNIVWSAASKALDLGDNMLYNLLESALLKWGVQRSFMIN